MNFPPPTSWYWTPETIASVRARYQEPGDELAWPRQCTLTIATKIPHAYACMQLLPPMLTVRCRCGCDQCFVRTPSCV